MDYLNSILSLQNQGPKLVEEAIPTLCDRLQHATLSSDRRSAVLGLRSFSRQYRESVVEYGLRVLVSTLKKDKDNLVTLKAVLETLLILFIRGDNDDSTSGWISQQSRVQNGKYPSPLLMDVHTDQLSLWIADELTQDHGAFEVLFDILQISDDFHVKIYTIQLLEALVATRPTKTKDSLLQIPTAISSLVALLKEPHEPVRNESILLLMAVVNNNFNIQKLVAFENTFETIFEIIDEEGGIRGSILVQDCMTLLTNLLKYNASNQKFFLETNCVPKITKLLNEPLEDGYEDNSKQIPLSIPPMVWTEQRLQNIINVLEICRTFVVEGNEFLKVNQSKFLQVGVLVSVLKLIFSPMAPNEVRSIALLVAGDFINGNPAIQLEFSRIEVPYVDPSLPSQIQSFDRTLPVTIALLNWALFINSVHLFEIRVNAAYCLHCYFRDNKESQAAFMDDQIKAYSDPDYYTREVANGMEQNSTASSQKKGQDTVGSTADIIVKSTDNENPLKLEDASTGERTPFGNIFSTLLSYDPNAKLNPYKVWFAVIVMLYLFEDNPDNKEAARSVNTGDENIGEEVMSTIQALTGLLITSLDGTNSRTAIGYLMLLTVWQYEDLKAINDFLSDSDNVKSLLASISTNTTDTTIIIQGMTSILLGISYEFSSKESPISRNELHTLLLKGIGRDNYSQKLKQFNDHYLIKNYEADFLLHVEKDETGLPEVYFDPIYTNLIKENMSRIKRALYHDPESEPQGRISYEVYEELDAKYATLKKEFNEKTENARLVERQLKQENERITSDSIELRESIKKLEEELVEIKKNHSAVSSSYEITKSKLLELEQSKRELGDTSNNYYKELQKALKQVSTSEQSVKALEQKLQQAEAVKTKLEDGINNMTRDLFHLKKEKNDSEQVQKSLEKQIKNLKSEIEKLTKGYESQLARLQKSNEDFGTKVSQLNKEIARTSIKDKGSNNKLPNYPQENEELKISNEHLMEKLRSAASAFQDIKQANISLESELTERKRELEYFASYQNASSKEIESLKSHLKELDTSGARSKDQLQEIKEKSRSLEDKFAEEHRVLLRSLENLELKVQDLQSENKDLTDKLNNSSATPNSKIDKEDTTLDSDDNDSEKHVPFFTEAYMRELKVDYESKINSLTTKLNETEDALNRRSSNLSTDLERSLSSKSTDGELEKVKEELATSKDEYNDIQKSYELLKLQLDTDSLSLHGDLVQTKKSKDLIDKELASYKTRTEEVLNDLNKERDELAKELDIESLNNLELSIENDVLNKKLKDYESYMEEEKSQLLVSQKVLEQKLKKNTSIEKEKASISDMLAKAFEKISSFEKKVEVLEKTNQDLNNQLEDGKSSSDSTESIRELENELQLTSIDEVLSSQDSKLMEQYTSRIEELEAELESKEKQQQKETDLSANESKSQKKIDNTDTLEEEKKHLVDKDQEVTENLNEQGLLKLQNKIKELESQLEVSNIDLIKVKKELNDVKKLLRQLESEKLSTSESLESIRKDSEKLREKVEELEAIKADLEDQLSSKERNLQSVKSVSQLEENLPSQSGTIELSFGDKNEESKLKSISEKKSEDPSQIKELTAALKEERENRDKLENRTQELSVFEEEALRSRETIQKLKEDLEHVKAERDSTQRDSLYQGIQTESQDSIYVGEDLVESEFPYNKPESISENRKEIIELKKKLGDQRLETEDLLLLLADVDKSKEYYKNQLMQLGYPVSSDEESEVELEKGMEDINLT